MPDRPRLAALDSLAPIRFAGSVYRVVPEALRGRIISTEGNRLFPGRYHIVGETGVLYTSASEDTAIRELGRLADRGHLQGGLAVGRIKIRLRNVLDLSDEANLRKLGVSGSDLISDDLSPTQAIGRAARSAGVQGLLVPSATGEGRNLVVFENNLSEGSLIEVEEVRIR